MLAVEDGTSWHFLSPASPHFGFVRTNLRKLIIAQFTYKEVATLITQIDAFHNSRQLCSISNNLDNIDVLTPGHLISDSLIAIPKPS